MKLLKTAWIKVTFLFTFLLLLFGCSSNNSTSLDDLTMYPVKITKVSTDDVNGFVVSGTTDAPKGSKILAKSAAKDNTDNQAESANEDNDSYEKVSSKGKFKINLNPENLKTSGEKLKVGQKVKVKIFAVTGYKEKFNDAEISGKLAKLLKKANIKWNRLKVDKTIHNQSEDSDDVIDKKNEDIAVSQLKIYPVKVTKTETTDEGNFILSGITNAPNSAKVLGQAPSINEEVDITSHVDTDDYYPKVNNGKFQIVLSSSDIFENTDKIKDGDTTDVKVFAVTGYNLPYEDVEIHGGLLQALNKSKLPNISIKADKKIMNYWKDDDSSSKNENKEADQHSKSENKQDNSNTSSKKNSKPKSSKTDKINTALQILQKNYAGQATVEYKNKMFEIKPNFDGASNIVVMVKSGDRDSWNNLTKSIDKVSKTLWDDVDLQIPVAIVNPANPDKVLYTSLDGESVYNFADDN